MRIDCVQLSCVELSWILMQSSPRNSPSSFYVEDFTSEGQNGLSVAVATLSYIDGLESRRETNTFWYMHA